MQQLQTPCASRAGDRRMRAQQQGQLRRPGRSQSRCWREREREETAAQTAEEALSAGCMKGATVDWRCSIGIDDGLASRRTSS